MHLKKILPELQPNQELIEGLEFLLGQAKEGILRSFIGAGEYHNKDICRSYFADNGMNAWLIIGGLTVAIDTIIQSQGLTKEVLLD
jgi:hypothetical protein